MSRVLMHLLVLAVPLLTPLVVGSQSHQSTAGTSVGTQGQECLIDQEALDDLKAREKELADQKAKLKEIEAELKAKEDFVSAEVTRLEELRKSITGIEAGEAAKQEERVAKIVATFERMSPKAAASMLDTLDDKLAVDAISRIDTEKLAKIMGKLSPERSSYLTELMAGRARYQNKAQRQLSSKVKPKSSEQKKGGQ